ncbi:MAG: hypothetical protein Q7S92_00995 [Candidatus Diapherotrites archaeon]|nr:hypothetical protein [Candidatus Diapherotrites archaeon]
MVEIREFTVDLKKRYKQPKPGRANKSINAIRLKVSKALHVPLDTVKLSNTVNEAIWEHGRTKPPHRIKLTLKQDTDRVDVFLFSEFEEVKKLVSEEKKKKESKKTEPKKEKTEKVEPETEAGVAEAVKQKQKKEIEEAAQSMDHKH